MKAVICLLAVIVVAFVCQSDAGKIDAGASVTIKVRITIKASVRTQAKADAIAKDIRAHGGTEVKVTADLKIEAKITQEYKKTLDADASIKTIDILPL